MAKSKYAPALFEVMNRQKNTGKLGVPKWWKGGPQEAESGAAPGGAEAAQPAGPDAAQGTQSPELTPRSAASSASPAVTNMRLVPADEAGREPVAETLGDSEFSGRWPAVRVESGRIFVAMGPTHAAVLGGGVLVLVMAAFLLGRSLGGGAAPGDGGLTTILGTPNPSVLQEPAAKTDAPPARASVKPAGAAGQPMTDAQGPSGRTDELKPGNVYVLLCSYPQGALPSAEHVQKWLASTHNIRTALFQRKDRYWLVATAPFADEKSAECLQFTQRVKDLSPDCLKELQRAKLTPYGFVSPMPFKAME